MDSTKFFAIIPAAGRSQRMGQPKLLLPWENATVIDSVLRAWSDSCVDRVFIVLRPDDHELIDVCEKWPVELVVLNNPTFDMKGSIIAGLDEIERIHDPGPADQVLIAPADLPKISTSLINSVAAANENNRIVVPYFGEKQGHPIRMPWITTACIRQIPEHEGLNSLITSSRIHRLDVDPAMRPRDIDTPPDYQREIGHTEQGR